LQPDVKDVEDASVSVQGRRFPRRRSGRTSSTLHAPRGSTAVHRFMSKPSVSLVIPMYDEELNIGHAVAASRDSLERYAGDYEIIVVDDASTDRSPQIVQKLAAEDPHVRVLRHESNRKLGATLRTGFAAATKDLVFYMDADIPFDPDVLGRAMRAMDLTGADMIAAYRHDRTMEGLKRGVYTLVYNWLIGVLFGWPHRDINFSFKLMKRRVLETVTLKSEGSLIDAELVVKAKNAGFSIQQIGIDYFPRSRGVSHLGSFSVVLKILRELVTLYPEMRRRGAAAADGGQPEERHVATVADRHR
jgi:glycosyltransferase involved in cell wall biosynthesis